MLQVVDDRLVGGNEGSAAVLRVVVGAIVGIVVYLGVLAMLRAPELDELRRRLGPSPSPTTAPTTEQ